MRSEYEANLQLQNPVPKREACINYEPVEVDNGVLALLKELFFWVGSVLWLVVKYGINKVKGN